MSKEETTPGGLLSKVVRFVRNPTVNWTELDSIQGDRESQYSKQMLKEMIERKRRNDFVRRREFDQLRKLRRREAQQGQRAEDPAARPSFFQGSTVSPDERAGTLKKIDEIEAQMSQQWWKNKGDGAVPPPPPRQAPASQQPASVPASAPAAPFAASSPFDGVRAFAPTVPLTIPSQIEAATAQTRPAELTPFVHDPDLEEAAILFANGDGAGAESSLKDLLAQHRQSGSPRQEEVWMALFDLYRATGQQASFDALGIDFAANHGRSAPQWFSMPGQLGLQGAQAASGGAARELSWNAPAVLTPQAVAALQAALARAAEPWTLTWARLTAIEPSALVPLAALFEAWAGQRAQLHFGGVQALHAVLQAHTQSGVRATDPQWWRLRMSALRMMGLVDEFELVALDYCVTYEVSPPSWESPRCSYSDDGVRPTAPAALARDSGPLSSGFQLSVPSGMDEPAPAVLEGFIEGDAAPALQPLDALRRSGAPLVVDCSRLVRVDFAAVGSVLNWAAAQQAEGHAVQFIHLHRLVAVFFNVIGINDHARVVPRQD